MASKLSTGGSGTADAFKASNSQTNIQILNNIVYQSTDEGIQLEGGTDYLVQYNYVKNPVGDGITFSSYSGTHLLISQALIFR
jgi:hypothetical protein